MRSIVQIDAKRHALYNTPCMTRGRLVGFVARYGVTNNFSENLRYMLWKREPGHREKWRDLVASWACVDPFRALKLLHGAEPTEDEIRRLADTLNLEQETLLYSRVLKPSEILFRNIDYLFDGLDHGMKGEYAKALGVDLSTISRWRRGKARPTSSHIDKLGAKFLLDPELGLEEQPLFLSPTPTSVAARREWIKTKIDQLSPAELHELFPAFRRLLGDVDGVD